MLPCRVMYTQGFSIENKGIYEEIRNGFFKSSFECAQHHCFCIRNRMKLSLINILLLCSTVLICADEFSTYRQQEALIRLLIHTKDNYGCDAIIPSCGPKGKCCDRHDACYKKYGCRANSWGWSCK